MVVCKYFQQGSCRFGQYCRFDHINNFGANQNDRSKTFGDNKSIVLGVAEEILTAERGGQWLLSCFGPFKEQGCIPGMEDVSPDEVRWEMYQAQKSGTVEQMKLQFQQLLQQMSAKREELKNPTHEIAAMLDKLQKGNKDSNTFASKSNFTLSSPQLGNNMSGSGIFAPKTYGNNTNQFGGTQFTSTGSSSIFSRSNTTTPSAFGAKPAFGGTPVFGNAPTGSSIFGGTTSTSSSIFGSSQTALPSFGAAAQQTSSIFGGTTNSQPAFGQPSIFGGANQPTNNVFGANQSTIFSGTQSTGQTIFGGTTAIQPTSSIFGGSSTANTTMGSMFGQPKTTTAFGNAPVFGGAPAFGTTPSPSIFGSQTTFNNSGNSFGANTATSTFGGSTQTNNSFSTLATPTQNSFSSQTIPMFGTAINPSTTTAFGSTPTTPSFGSPSFGTNVTTSPFARPFANQANATQSFGQAVTPTSAFGSPTTPGFSSNSSPSTFSSPNFASVQNTPFAATTTTSTSSNSNPFGVTTTTTSSGNSFGGMSTGLFDNRSQISVNNIDIYSAESELTDEEKNMYIANEFVLGKIPINPPTIELR